MPAVGAQNFDKRRGRRPLMMASVLDNMENYISGLRLEKQAQYTNPKKFVEQKSGA